MVGLVPLDFGDAQRGCEIILLPKTWEERCRLHPGVNIALDESILRAVMSKDKSASAPDDK
jgi:hypothetical protein